MSNFQNRDLASYINKRVEFGFSSERLRFDLSQGLFSSNDIDAGTRLLLKSLAQQVDLSGLKSVLDVGCGVGVIGIAIKKRVPHARIIMQDRDALALAFTEHNLALNGLSGAKTSGNLALRGLSRAKFDLIVSNLPAKAGKPVLDKILSEAPQWLTTSGRVAVVVVRGLAPFVREVIVGKHGCSLLWEESTSSHMVFHYACSTPEDTKKALPPGLTSYIRSKKNFSHNSLNYELDTVFNLAEFDTLGIDTGLAFRICDGMLDSLRRLDRPRILCWNPGQGHLPMYLAKKLAKPFISFILAGRDLLQLEISKYNLDAKKTECSLLHLFSEEDVIDHIDKSTIDLAAFVSHTVHVLSFRSHATIPSGISSIPSTSIPMKCRRPCPPITL